MQKRLGFDTGRGLIIRTGPRYLCERVQPVRQHRSGVDAVPRILHAPRMLPDEMQCAQRGVHPTSKPRTGWFKVPRVVPLPVRLIGSDNLLSTP